MKKFKKQNKLSKRLIWFFLIAIVCVFTLSALLNPLFSIWINSLNHQRQVILRSNPITISFSVPSYLHTQKELQNGITNETFTNITAENSFNLYSSDKKINQYYYQVNGMDVLIMIMVHSPSEPYNENIPFDIAKKTTLYIHSGIATLYIYPGADGDGHGRGKLGSVHQGTISLDSSKNIGLAFYCYDHSSGDKISQRCDNTVQMLLNTVHIQNNIFSIFFK